MNGCFPVRWDGVGLSGCVRWWCIFLGVFWNKIGIVTYICGKWESMDEHRKGEKKGRSDDEPLRSSTGREGFAVTLAKTPSLSVPPPTMPCAGS